MCLTQMTKIWSKKAFWMHDFCYFFLNIITVIIWRGRAKSRFFIFYGD